MAIGQIIVNIIYRHHDRKKTLMRKRKKRNKQKLNNAQMYCMSVSCFMID